MGDICERSTVNDCWCVLKRLYEIRCKGIFKKYGHGAIRIKVTSQNRLLFPGIAHHDISKATLQIFK